MEEKGITLGNNVTELTAIAPLYPGTARRLREILKERRKEIENTDPEENLIRRIQTIHYARWVIIDNDTRLLFTSNFDGDLEGYLEDFSEFDQEALDGIFGFCVGFPGAKPVGPFIEYVKAHQVPATLFYAAYPEYSVKQVMRALEWKKKTDAFLEKLEGKWRSTNNPKVLDRLTKEFIQDLEKPTPFEKPIYKPR